MRLLILGTVKSTTSKLAKQCVNMFSGLCVVVSPTVQSKKMWSDRSYTVVKPDELKIENYADDTLVVDRVTNTTFLKTQPTKNMLSSCKNLIIITDNPIEILDADTLQNFDKVLISKTTRVDKMMQYFTIFVDTKNDDFASFKHKVTNLKGDSYLELDTKTRKLSTPFTSEPVVKTTLTPPDDLKNAATILSQMFNHTTSDKPILTDALLETWVLLHVKDVDTNAQQVISAFKKMISMDVIKSMYTFASFDQLSGSDHQIAWYFHVNKERNDLFTSLVMNMIRALKEKGSIQHGCFLV